MTQEDKKKEWNRKAFANYYAKNAEKVRKKNLQRYYEKKAMQKKIEIAKFGTMGEWN